MAEGKSGATAKKRSVTPKPAAVTPAPVTPTIVGKAGLCDALGWTRPRLDRRLESDAAFPVAKRGTRAGGWEFDVAVVRAYLGGAARAPAAAAPEAKSAPTIEKSEQGTAARVDSRAGAENPYPGAKYTAVPPAGVEPVVHAGEQTARQRRDLVQAEILEDKLRRDRGELVQVEVMRQVLNTMLVHLGKGLDRLSDQVVERLGLPEESSADIRAVTDDLRRTMADELRVLLG
jgi:hypothetical protein